MKFFRDTCHTTNATRTERNISVPTRYPQFNVIVTESPQVSPSVVAAILITKNVKVASGTLLKVALAESFMLPFACCCPNDYARFEMLIFEYAIISA